MLVLGGYTSNPTCPTSCEMYSEDCARLYIMKQSLAGTLGTEVLGYASWGAQHKTYVFIRISFSQEIYRVIYIVLFGILFCVCNHPPAFSLQIYIY
jgi:hypothetical protein